MKPQILTIIDPNKFSEFYSQLRVECGGCFNLSIQNPISNYTNSWLSIMDENFRMLKFDPSAKGI